jgi:hypothetical protein
MNLICRDVNASRSAILVCIAGVARTRKQLWGLGVCVLVAQNGKDVADRSGCVLRSNVYPVWKKIIDQCKISKTTQLCQPNPHMISEGVTVDLVDLKARQLAWQVCRTISVMFHCQSVDR